MVVQPARISSRRGVRGHPCVPRSGLGRFPLPYDAFLDPDTGM